MALVKLCQFKPHEDLAGHSLVQWFCDLLIDFTQNCRIQILKEDINKDATSLISVDLNQYNPEVNLSHFLKLFYDKGENVKVFRRTRVNHILLLIWNTTVNKTKIRSRSKILRQSRLQLLGLRLVRPVLYLATTHWHRHLLRQGLWSLWRWCTLSLAAGTFESVGKRESENGNKQMLKKLFSDLSDEQILSHDYYNTMVSTSLTNMVKQHAHSRESRDPSSS